MHMMEVQALPCPRSSRYQRLPWTQMCLVLVVDTAGMRSARAVEAGRPPQRQAVGLQPGWASCEQAGSVGCMSCGSRWASLCRLQFCRLPRGVGTLEFGSLWFTHLNHCFALLKICWFTPQGARAPMGLAGIQVYSGALAAAPWAGGPWEMPSGVACRLGAGFSACHALW